MSYIEDSEKEATDRMLAEGKLPRPERPKDQKILRKMGIKLRGKGLLQQATLPVGWAIVRTSNRHGNVVDTDGVVRASFFYKGVFYDRRGFLRPENYEDVDKRPWWKFWG